MRPNISDIAKMLTDDPDIFNEDAKTQLGLDMPTSSHTINPEATRVDIPEPESNEAQIKQAIQSGDLPKGNVELAALLGHRGAALALGKNPNHYLTPHELIEMLLTDPVIVTIETAAPTD